MDTYTWIQTKAGPKQVGELVGKPFVALIDGEECLSTKGFFCLGRKQILELRTVEGLTVRLTNDSQLCRVTTLTRYRRTFSWADVGSFATGNLILLPCHRSSMRWGVVGTEEEGYLLGSLVGDGHLKKDSAVISVWEGVRKQVMNGPDSFGGQGIMLAAEQAALAGSGMVMKFWPVNRNGEFRMKSRWLLDLANRFGLCRGDKNVTSKVEASSRGFHAGFLRGLFDADGSVQGTQEKGVSVRLTQSSTETLERAQRMLLRFGVVSTIYKNRKGPSPSMKAMPDGKGGTNKYWVQPFHELVISCDNLAVFQGAIGFADSEKAATLAKALTNYRRACNRERFVNHVAEIRVVGEALAYGVCTVGGDSVDANGFRVRTLAR